MKARYLVCLVLVTLSGYACSSSDESDKSDEPEPSVTPMPPAKTVGTAGGSVTATGVELAIPAGALSQETPITITTGEQQVPVDYTGLSPVYTFAPDGTVFEKPVIVSFTLTNKGTAPTVYWSNATGGYDELPTTLTATGVTASVTHFSHGFVAEKKKKHADDAGTTTDASSDASTDASSDASTDASNDASTDASSDAGTNGMTVTIDGVVTTFATNAFVSPVAGGPVISADDNASADHWTIQIQMTTVPQQTCQPNGNPTMTYTHHSGAQIDAVYSSKAASSSCVLLLSHNPANPGEHATGKIISATLNELSGPASPTSHTFASGSFDIVY